MEPTANNNLGAEPVSNGQINTEQDALDRAAIAQAELANYKKNKISKGMLFGLVFCLTLAAGGIGFGVWAMMDGNARADKLNKQITDLNAQIANMSGQDDGEFENPVIVSDDSGEMNDYYYVGHTVDSSVVAEKKIEIYLRDGSISVCRINGKDCNINGLSGEIYKVVDFGAGQDGSGFNIGFIMKDGTVKYVPLPQSDDITTLNVAGTLNVDGNVVDLLPVSVHSEDGTGGYASTIIVLSDGSLIKFDKSMLN